MRKAISIFNYYSKKAVHAWTKYAVSFVPAVS